MRLARLFAPLAPDVERPRSSVDGLMPLLFVALAVAACASPLLQWGGWSDEYDWRYFQTHLEIARRSVLWFGQVPLWDPYTCGGQVALANPQSETASPTFLLTLIFGTAVGIKVSLLAFYFCAYDGMYRLCRWHGLGAPGALAGALLFGGTGWLALHLSTGHSNFASAALFPYLVLFYRRGLADARWTLALGLVAASIVGLGGTSTPAMATVLLVTIGAIDGVRRRSLRPLVVLLGGACWGGLFGAWRILPALEFAVAHPRHQWETDANSLWSIVSNAFRWQQLSQVPGKRYWFHEYSWRLAGAAAPLLVWAAWAKKTRRYFVLALVAGSIVAGAAIPYGPWWLLKHLPIYRDLRVPSRYSILLAFSAALLCAGAVDDLVARLRQRRRMATALVALVLASIAVETVAFDWFCYRGRSGRGVFAMHPPLAKRSAPFYQEEGNWTAMMGHVLLGHGAVGCDEEAPLQRAHKLDIGAEQAQVKLSEPHAGNGRITSVDWSPNRVEVAVELTASSRVLFNENWNEHWKTTHGSISKHGGKVARDFDGGRLAADVPAGSYTFAVYYRPRSFVIGATTTLLAPPIAWLWLLMLRRRRKALSPYY